MKLSLRARAFAVLATAGALALLPALSASAHEARTIGPLDVEVGFGTEPALTNQPNSVQFIVNKGGKPVINLGDSVQVEVQFGSVSSDPMTLVPGFVFEDGKLDSGEPGDYRAYFTPTQPGKYTFHFTGNYEGTKIDESFTSSPSGFDSVEDPTLIPAVNAPTNEQLATRIDQESTRSEDAVATANAAATSADDAASSAKTVGIVGVALGAIGIILGGVALATRKRG